MGDCDPKHCAQADMCSAKVMQSETQRPLYFQAQAVVDFGYLISASITHVGIVWCIYEFVCVSALITPRFEREHVLLAQRLDIHKRISGASPRPPRCSCVMIVTLMTLVTLFWRYPYTISQIQRHQRHLRHSDFVFLVVSLFLFRAVVNCKRHFTISVTVVTMVTVFVGQGKGVCQKHRHHRQHRHSTGKPF